MQTCGINGLSLLRQWSCSGDTGADCTAVLKHSYQHRRHTIVLACLLLVVEPYNALLTHIVDLCKSYAIELLSQYNQLSPLPQYSFNELVITKLCGYVMLNVAVLLLTLSG